jgi:dethiobiotin synthetase
MDASELLDSGPVRIAVVGTGTDVGKTHLSVALLHALTHLGVSAVGLKPVESGLGDDQSGGGTSDTARLAAAGMFHVKHPAPYRFPDPVSPHLAARRVGIEIAPDRILDWVAACAAPWTVVETAGGLLSPLGLSFTNLDLVQLLAPDVVLLVGVDRLGVLHDVAACRLALSTLAPTLPEPHVVLQSPAVNDSSTGTNAEELSFLGLAAEVTVIPRGASADASVVEAALALVARIQARRVAKRFT